MLRLWRAYTGVLSRRPLQTRMVTSGCLFSLGDVISQQGIERRGFDHDPTRTLRLAFYGTALFAPLVNTWLSILERVKFTSTLATVGAKVALDIGLWGPFIVGFFWTANGFLEGKTIPQVKEKVRKAYLPAVSKSVLVFGPTQALNFWLVPVQYRMLVTQTVGLGWNTFLSYSNNQSNMVLDQVGM